MSEGNLQAAADQSINPERKGTRWQTLICLILLVSAILLGAPAVGHRELTAFIPFLVALTVGLGVAIYGLRRGTTWNRIGSGVSLLLLIALCAGMVIAVNFREPP